jgi:hypothetical protein
MAVIPPALDTTMPAGLDKLKRVFSGITLTTNDLTTIATRAAEIGQTVAMKANAVRLSDIDELPQVMAEDVVLDRLTMMVFDANGAALEFTWEPSYVLVQVDGTSPGARPAFDAIVALLASRPRNGFNYNVVEISPPGSWTPPTASTTASTDQAESSVVPATARAQSNERPADGLLIRLWKRMSRPQGRDRDRNPK